jgi:hypothetical protein
VKNLKFKYRLFSKTVVMLMLFAFCATSIASDCFDCVCSAKQKVKKEMKCCSGKTEKKCCCNKEKKSEKTENKSGKDCNNCSVKKRDIKSPFTTNENTIIKSSIIKIDDKNLPLNQVNAGIQFYNVLHPPGKACKLYLVQSVFRI